MPLLLAETTIGGFEIKYLTAMVLMGVLITTLWLVFRRLFKDEK